jgi:YggT family protein
MSHNSNDESNFKRQQELLYEEEAFRLHQEEKNLESARRITTLSWIINGIFWFLGIIEMLLVMRFMLRLFGANQENQFAQLINTLSKPFMAPFSSLFISPTSSNGTNIFDVNIMIAIIVYTFLSYLLVSIIRFLFYQNFR